MHRMAGLEQTKISTPDVDRILAADALDDVYSYGVKIAGQKLLRFGLRDTGVTLAYDATSGTWARWTSLTARAPASCTIAQTGGVATITWTAHGRSDGDPVVISRGRSECLQRFASGALLDRQHARF